MPIGRWDSTTSTIVASRRSEHAVGIAAPIYPFSVDADDHCETPSIAYEHIVPLLSTLAQALNKSSPYNLHIWDPFFCAGSVANHLNNLGFDNVYNENEDFYAYDAGKTSGPQQYDVLITNPPYTANHIPSLLKFCKDAGKPCLLLLPNYCLHKYKEQLVALESSSSSPSSDLFFVWSKARYKYKSPKFARTKDKARKDRVTSPFVSFWYCYIPSTWKQQCTGHNTTLSVDTFRKKYEKSVQKATSTVPARLLHADNKEEGTKEQELAKRLTKGRFASSAQNLPAFLLDRAQQQQSGSTGGSGSSKGSKKKHKRGQQHSSGSHGGGKKKKHKH